MTSLHCDICIIGAGSGGLSVAAGASQMGANVILVERDKMGGDCLNTGCVPSKALLAASKHAHTFRSSTTFGIKSHEPEIDFAKVNQHVHEVISKIAPNDSVERFTELGVKVIQGQGSFIDKHTLQAGDNIIKAKRFVIATGSRAIAPPIPGLDNVDYLTNQNIFTLTQKPEHLIIIGGGPIGCEMAQAHLRLGVNVTLLQSRHILPKDDQELTDIVKQQLINDGLHLFEGVKIVNVECNNDQYHVTIKQPKTHTDTLHSQDNISTFTSKQTQHTSDNSSTSSDTTSNNTSSSDDNDSETLVITGSHLLIAAGRKSNTEDLNLEAANIKFNNNGILVDNRLRSVTNKRVFAIGDVAGSYQFTHIASYHAGIVIRNALFHIPAKVDYKAVPWCTYTSPELAHVGMDENQAKAFDKKARTLTWPLTENDRAQAERTTEGMLKVSVSRKGVILGASIVCPNAGELLLPWTLAVQNKMKISAMASVIAPYPTFSEASKRIAGSYYTDALFSPKVKRIVRFLNKIFR